MYGMKFCSNYGSRDLSHYFFIDWLIVLAVVVLVLMVLIKGSF